MQIFLMKIALLLVFVFFVTEKAIADESIAQLPGIHIEAREISESLTTPSVEAAENKLKKIPGGTSIISQEVIRSGNTRSLEEALTFSPGVYARSRFGSDEVRISIRGSGISQTFNTRGIRLLRDGLPITEADGNVRPQLIDILNAQYIEVYRGANALEYGSALLGGAINLVSPNARTSNTYPIRLEVGSDNYLRGQATYGLVTENGMDIYNSITGIEHNGFRENSEQETLRYYGNIGKRWNNNHETRMHIDLQDSNLELPGSITKQQLEQDPSQANFASLLRNSQRDINLYRISAQHNVLLKNGGKAAFGASYQHLDTRIPLPFAFLEADQNDASVSTRFTQNIKFNKQIHNLTFGGLALWGDNEGDRFDYVNGDNKGRQIRDDDDRAWGIEAFFQDRIQVNSDTDIIIGTQLIHAKRETSEVPISVTGMSEESLDRSESYTGFNPRLGFIKKIGKDITIFGNINRSYEPPTVTEFSTLLDDGTFEILDAQKASTLELGIRRTDNKRLNYEITTYYSNIDDEILTQEDPSLPSGSNETVTSNANDTVHGGVEIGINGRITDNINLNMSYTYNDFKFDNDESYGNNTIPGIPHHIFNAELMYRSDSGFYIGPTINYSSDWYVDFENTTKADSYILLGAKMKYELDNNMQIFVQGVNLTDKVYASNTAITDVANNDSSLFNPGIDRSIFIGFQFEM